MTNFKKKRLLNKVNPIRAFKVSFSNKEISNYLDFASEILNDGLLIPGKYNLQLEKAFAGFCGTKYCIAVSSGTAALEIICRSLNLPRKEVLIPANTNYATAEAVLRAGAIPILYDSDLFPDFESIKNTISKKTKAVVIVHIGGYITPEINEIVRFCEENNIFLIEDASHAHGSKYKNRTAGSFGIAGAMSMFATKVITTSEGGLILTNDEKIRSLSLTYRDQGKADDGVNSILFGSSWRMSELHAALGVVQTQNFNNYLKRNNEIVKFYVENIKASNILVPYKKDSYYSGYKFVIILPNNSSRESLKKYLLQNDIIPGKGIYEVPLHHQPVLPFSGNKARFPKAELFAQNHLCLPIWKGMLKVELERVVNSINLWSENS